VNPNALFKEVGRNFLISIILSEKFFYALCFYSKNKAVIMEHKSVTKKKHQIMQMQ
jgi:hypothetical protein